MKTLRWIAAALTLALTMGVASARDRDDAPRSNCVPYYGGYYVQPYRGYWNDYNPGYYGYGFRDRDGDRDRDDGYRGRDRDDRRWDRDRDRDDRRFDRDGGRRDRDGFRFRF